jgi:hypothetical protein
LVVLRGEASARGSKLAWGLLLLLGHCFGATINKLSQSITAIMWMQVQFFGAFNRSQASCSATEQPLLWDCWLMLFDDL